MVLYRSQHRSRTGSVLVLTIAITTGLIMALVYFALTYTRLVGAHEEQRSAVESAALAAAKDLSSIVVQDPQLGFIGLSDSAPIGTGTIAGDNYYLSVEGVNTLEGTVRLDTIIADYVSDPLMTQYVGADYQSAMNCISELNGKLSQAVQPNGSGTDIYNNAVNPTKDATDAYQRALIRLTGGKTTLVPNSLKLTLGFVDGLQSYTPVPQPMGAAQVAANQMQYGNYIPNITIACDGQPYVFAAAGKDNITLVDHKAFTTGLSNLPFSIPAVVKCEADEQFTERDQSGNLVTRTVHCIAAADAAYMRDRRPAPGAFSLSFPNGPVPEIKSLSDVFLDMQIVQAPCDLLQTSLTGDAPPAPLSDFTFPYTSSALSSPTHPYFGDTMSVAFYDWIRRAGLNANVKNIVDMLTQPLAAGPGFGQMHEWQVMPDGVVNYQVIACPALNYPVSQNQWRAITGQGFYSVATGQRYDLQTTDFCYQPGRTQGGKHAGEPLEGTSVTSNPATQPPPPPPANAIPGVVNAPANNSFYATPSLPSPAFTVGPGGGAVRPTYQTTGIAADITFRVRS